MLALILAALLGQTAGGSGNENPITIKTINDQWLTIGLPATSLGVTPGTTPDFQAVPAGATTFQRCFDDTNTEGLVFTFKTITEYKPGKDIDVGLQWSPYTTDLGTVVWNVDCSGPTAVDDAWQNPTNFRAESDGRGTLHQLTAVDMGTISGFGVTTSGGLLCSVYRDPTDGADDFVGDACLAGVTFAFPINKVGADSPGL